MSRVLIPVEIGSGIEADVWVDEDDPRATARADSDGDARLALELAFDPNQPRDEKGRWRKGGGYKKPDWIPTWRGSGGTPGVTEGTEEEQAALIEYTDGAYRAMNSSLRAGHAMSERSKNLDRLIRKQPATDHVFFAYRGVKVERFIDLKPGDKFTDNGFLSMSKSMTAAENFGARGVIEVAIPTGTKMLDVAEWEARFGGEVASMIVQEDEHELLLPPGMTMVLDSRHKEEDIGLGERMLFEMHLEPTEPQAPTLAEASDG